MPRNSAKAPSNKEICQLGYVLVINDRPILKDVAEIPEFSNDVVGCIAHSSGILPLLGSISDEYASLLTSIN